MSEQKHSAMAETLLRKHALLFNSPGLLIAVLFSAQLSPNKISCVCIELLEIYAKLVLIQALQVK